MIGYDLDGIIVRDIPKILYKICPKFAVWLRDQLAPAYVPEGEFVIITERPYTDEKRTLAWLKSYSICPVLVRFANGGGTDKAYLCKAWDIYTLRLEVFYESSEKHIEGLRKLCSQTKIKLWRRV